MMEQHHSQSLLKTSPFQPASRYRKTPPEKPRKLSRSKDRTALMIGWILRGGVIVSAVLTLLGLVLLPFRSGGLTALGLDTFPHTLGAVWVGLLGLHPTAVIELGLLLLIATPVVTVATSALAFAIERDRRFVAIALLVLAILLTSFLLGKNG